MTRSSHALIGVLTRRLACASFFVFAVLFAPATAAAANATSTTFSCAPYPITGIELNVATTCTVTVTDTGGTPLGSPTGTVAWTRAGAGSAGTFTGSPCTLSAATSNTSTCSVTFTPTNITSGTITAAYTTNNATNWTSSTSAAGTYTVIAANGSGTLSVSPTSAVAGSTGNTFTFTFTAPTSSGSYVAGAQATILIPAGWTAPQSTVATNPGYVTVTGGTCGTRTIASVTGSGPWTVTLNIACTSAQTFILTYAGGGTKVTAHTTAGAHTFTVQTKNNNGTLASIATSPVVTVTFAAANKLLVTTDPSNSTGGVAFPTQPVITVQDTYGNTVTTSTASITLTITTNPGGGALTCTANPKAAVAGVATFAGCKIDLAGTGYILTASSTGLTSDPTTAFDITVGPAAKLAFTTSPSNATAGAAFGTQPIAVVQDAGGNTVTTSSASVTVAIGTNPGGGTLSGTVNVNAINGVVTYSGLSINKSGTGYTLTATSTGLTLATSSTFNITAASPAQLIFSTQPGGGTGGTAWATQPVVTVQDALGNTVTTDNSDQITLAIGTNPGSGTLTCTTNPVTAGSGIVTFAGCKIDKAANGYTLTATSGSLTSATSNTFNITVGAAAKLAFSTSPSDSTGGVAFSTQPSVVVQDAGGNTVTSSSASITLAIGTNPGGGALTCTANPKAATSGVATFAGCKIDKAGAGYTLTATATGLTLGTSATFNITVGTATKLGFTTQPGGGTSQLAWAAQPIVVVQDAGGNTVTSDNASVVTLAIATNPGSGTLSCTTNPVTVLSGVATFSGCSIEKSGNGYTLTATSSGLTSVTSSAFNIAAGAATQVAITTEPGGGTSGVAWTTQPVVTVRDAAGNTVTTSSASITLTILNNAGGGTLTCTANPKAAVSGVATFAGCKISTGGIGYTLTASSSGLTSDTTASFNVNDATTTTINCTASQIQLNDTVTCTATVTDNGVTFGSPGGTVAFALAGGAGTITGSPCTLSAATSTTSTCTVTFAPSSTAAGTLQGTYTSANTTNWASSVSVTFSYTVIAADGSGTMTVTPTTVTAGTTANSFSFTYTTAAGSGNYVSGAEVTIQIPVGWTAPQSTVAANPGYVSITSATCNTATMGTITGTGPWTITINLVCAQNKNFVLSYAGTGAVKVTASTTAGPHTFTVQTKNSGGTLTNIGTSPVVTVNAAAANKVAFTTQPSNGTIATALPTQPVVTVQDTYGNTITGSTASITLAIGTNPGGGTLTCTTNPLTAASGVATFAGCKINNAGTGYTLTASATGLTSATSATFNVAGTATKLVFTTQPAGATVGSAFSSQPVVKTQDALGNNSTVGLPSSLSLTLTIASGGGTLLGTATIDVGTGAGNGIATFTGLEIDTAQTNTLQAAVAGGSLTSATSNSLVVARANTVTAVANVRVTYGQANATLTATVVDGNASVSEGTVTFTVRDNLNNVVGSPITSGTVSSGGATASFPLASVPTGSYTISATYDVAASNPNFNTSSAANPGVLILTTTTTTTVLSGSYAGNGTADTLISDLGFQPDVVIVKADATQEAVIWTSTMTGKNSKPMSANGALATNMIKSAADSSGFVLGTDARVNANGTTYYWTAFGAGTGEMSVGTYTGNGTGQSIAGVGFQPALVIALGSSTTAAAFRTSAISNSADFTTGAPSAVQITSLDADGFTVGTSAKTNSSGVVYHYIAWKQVAGKMAVGSYAGNGSTRSITSVGFQPEVVTVKSYDCTNSGQQHTGALTYAADASLPFDTTSGSATNMITSLDSDGFGLGTNGGVNGGGCNYTWMAWAGASPTAVTMISASATRYDKGTLTQWATGDEVSNLGFHVYREVNGERTRVTRSIIAGSGLMTGQGTTTRGERRYAFWDLDAAAKDRSAVYYIQDLDFSGTSTWHGPVTPADGGVLVPPDVISSLSLRDVNKGSKHRGKTLRIEGTQLEPRWTKKRAPVPQTQLDVQWSLAAQPAVKIGVTRAGWYRVTQPELVAGGLDPSVNPRMLRLYAEGIERAIVVTGETDGRFDPTDAIEFYGTGLDTPFTDTRVYWLVAGTSPARRIAIREGSLRGRSSQNVSWGNQSFWYTVQQKERSIFFAALTNGEAENWFGQVISPEPTDIGIAVPHVDRAAASPAQLEITLQGVTVDNTLPDHRVAVLVNESEVGEVVFKGQALATERFAVRTALLAEGANVVRLIARGGDADYSLVDTIRLSYWHTYDADADVVAATADAPGPVAIGGFASRAIRLVDITDPTTVEEIRGEIAFDQNGLARITAQLTGSDVRTLFGFSDATISTPAYVRANRPSSWHDAAAGYEYLAITHALFAPGAEMLAATRRQHDLTAAVVDVEDIYDEFNFGEKTPQALKDFVQRAHTTGKHAPRFVVLVGDATLDPRDYSGLGGADFVPTAQVHMAQVSLETASDDWFADADEDGVPELAVGRLSVRTPVQAQQIVAKIVGYESSNDLSWTKSVLVVADENDSTSNFEASSRALRSLVPPDYTVRQVFRGALGADETRLELLDAVNQGQLIVNYNGHGSMRVWGHDANLLTADDIRDTWHNSARLPFVIAMNCLNGFFHDIYDEESLGETFLRAPQGGAIAAWASSALTQPGPQARVNQELFRLLFTRPDLTVGEAIAAAKRVITNQDVRRSWIFFGDPALRLRGVATSVAPSVTDTTRLIGTTVLNVALNETASPESNSNRVEAFDDRDVHLADFTADGRDDVLLYAPDTGWQVFAATLNEDAAADMFFYRRETGDWVTAINVNPTAGQFTYRSGRWTSDLQILISDLNADGHDEVIAYDSQTGVVILAHTDTSGGLVERRLNWPSGTRLHTGDFNADGLRDVVGYDTVTGRGFVALNGKRDFTVSETQWGAGWHATVADLNEDWRSDLVFYDPLTGAARLAISEARSGFSFQTRSWTPGVTLHAADLSGDGHEGLFGYSAETGAWFTGAQMPKGWAEQFGRWSAGSQIAIGDLNGDRRDDVVSYDPLTGLGSTCYNVSPGVFKCAADVRVPGRLFIGRPR